MKPNITKEIDRPYAEVLEEARQALAGRGFGILTEIDVQATLREKLGEETSPYIILGACIPPLAHRAMTSAPEVGVFLPCNLVVRETGPGRCAVDVINTGMMARMFPGAEDLEAVAKEVGTRFEAILDQLG